MNPAKRQNRSRRHPGRWLAPLLVLAACGSGGGGTAGGGDRLPDVAVMPLGGGAAVSLAAIEGPAVVNLWATWCGPCRREIPDFEAVHRARHDEVRFVGVNIGEDAGRAAEFITDIGATYDQFLDPEGLVSTELKATAMPLTVVIDAGGTITTRHLGPMDQDALDAAIDGALDAAG